LKRSVLIFTYDDYRKYLKDFYLECKAGDPKYSYRYFSRLAGYKSASAFLEVMNGKKNLSQDGIKKFSQALSLNRIEFQYFKALVLFNQTSSSEEKAKYAKEISRLRLSSGISLLSESQFKLFEKWYYTAILEMVTLDNFKEDPEWIASNLVPPIQPQQASRALETLMELGLLKRGDAGKLIQSEGNLTTPDEVSNAFLTSWHREYLKKASENIDIVDRANRDISAVYFAFSEEAVGSLKELIHKFRKDVLELASKEKSKTAVYQLNLQLFPVSENQGGRK
jgi:uncharacterized protein (TIGR02147 family)